jgi:hypothetical protein
MTQRQKRTVNQAEQLTLFPDARDVARAERRRIIRERLRELELDRMYPPHDTDSSTPPREEQQ